MTVQITFDSSHAQAFIKDHELLQLAPFVRVAHEMLHKARNEEDWLGWVEYPFTYDISEHERIKSTADRVRSDSDVLIIIGVGGSYLGSRAIIEMLPKSNGIDILFVGHHLSSDYINELLDSLIDREVTVNVISKSGVTLEPAIAFLILGEWMEKRYGESAKERIIITTDKEHGHLRNLAMEKGYETFDIPRDIGGRYSAFTPVGLLPMAVAGVHIDELLAGAKRASMEYKEECLSKNPCYTYAAMRNIFSRKGKGIEILVNYHPHMMYFGEWWKQLYGESEGKDGKGIFPATAQFTTDLHSLGQLIQNGYRNLFETVLYVEQSHRTMEIPKTKEGSEGSSALHALGGKDLDSINRAAFQGTVKAHVEGGVPVSIIQVPVLSPKVCGALIYFFQKACAMSGYLLGVNPFDQPGVEVYKTNMLSILGKY